MTPPKPTTIDFETFGIESRPSYPPIPVGVSIKPWGEKPKYYSWGHPTGNNCGWGDAYKALYKVWDQPEGLLFQNGKFDIDVAETHMDLDRRDWSCYHDTLFLLFLDDPHQKELGLKPSADRLLGMPPEEQDAVKDWLLANQPLVQVGIKMSASRDSDHYFAKYIAFAPGDLVGKYANGDVVRTEKLFKLLYQKIVDRKMLDAYDRERRLLPILLEIERQGVPVDLARLRRDVASYTKVRDQLDQWLYKQLKMGAHNLNLDSGAQLVKALVVVKKVDVDKLGVTEKGKYKTDKESLLAGVTDKQLLGVLKYRTQLSTCLHTFMEPWLHVAELSGGKIFTTWNQVKGDVGTRTGRLSSTPNFQNIPKEFAVIFAHELKGLPKSPFKLPTLPQVRSYIIPWDKTHVLLDRDYSQQELRVLGHFEDGALAAAYGADPWLDVHDFARTLINKMTGKNFDRKPIKNTGFGLIYGMGVGKLAIKSDVTVEVAKEVKDAYLAIFPGLKQMYQDMRVRAMSKLPIRTWGGREYFCEEPRFIEGRLRTFDYKLINYLVQGSSADCTKEALIRYWKAKSKDVKLLINVHDEILISAPVKQAKPAMLALRQAMESIEFDVPMLSEGSYSLKTWAGLKTFDEKGVTKWRM